MPHSHRDHCPDHWKSLRSKKDEILNVRAEVSRHRTPSSALVDWIGNILARPNLFFVALALHLLWMILNLPIFPWPLWDPYPFTFLATIASAEAPFIALLVLMYQQRSGRIDELREEINLQVSLHVEREASLLIRLLREIQAELNVESQQDESFVETLQQELDPKALMEQLRDEPRRAEDAKGPTAP